MQCVHISYVSIQSFACTWNLAKVHGLDGKDGGLNCLIAQRAEKSELGIQSELVCVDAEWS